MILAEQNVRAAKRVRGVRLERARCGQRGNRDAVKIHLNREGRAFSDLAVHADGSAHPFHHALGDGESQPGTPRGRDVAAPLLREGIEQGLLEFRPDADSVIGNLNLHVQPGVFKRIKPHPVGDGSALRRIFDRVGKQIKHHLIDAQLVQ